MARGLDKHRARQGEVAMLGRSLSRRARSVCELCGEKDDLRPVEVEPLPEYPEEDHALLACARCRAALAGGRKAPDPGSLRFLETAVWSEVPAVQVAAVQLATRLGQAGEGWARELVEGLWLAPEVEEWIAAAS